MDIQFYTIPLGIYFRSTRTIPARVKKKKCSRSIFHLIKALKDKIRNREELKVVHCHDIIDIHKEKDKHQRNRRGSGFYLY